MAGAVIVGAGPGIGTSVARRFGQAGMRVGLVARTAASIETARAALAKEGVGAAGAIADAAQETELRAALDELTGQLGVPEVLVSSSLRTTPPGRSS